MAFDILVVDDERDICELVSGILEDSGYSTRCANTVIEAIEAISNLNPNLVILDVWLGEGEKDGLRLLELIKQDHEFVPVIMMSGHGTIDTAVQAIRNGAYDFIEKPFDSNRLLIAVAKAIESAKLKRENAELQIRARAKSGIIGSSSAIINLRQKIAKVSTASGRCFIEGPAGSDKEGIVRELHMSSPQKDAPLIFINCSSKSASQLETDLFGSQIENDNKKTIRHGAFEKANGGAIYLDDVDSLPKDLQSKLIRLLRDGWISRVGGSNRFEITARIFSGSSANMQALVENGSFSEDLYYRLCANVITIPPLSTRAEDIPILLKHFMSQAAFSYNIAPKYFSEEVVSILRSYQWPGDMTQLRNLVDWVLIMSTYSKDSEVIEVCDLPKEITEGGAMEGIGQLISSVTTLSIKEAREAFEREYLEAQLRRFSGNISQTSKFVGMERSALHRKLRALKISDGREKESA